MKRPRDLMDVADPQAHVNLHTFVQRKIQLGAMNHQKSKHHFCIVSKGKLNFQLKLCKCSELSWPTLKCLNKNEKKYNKTIWIVYSIMHSRKMFDSFDFSKNENFSLFFLESIERRIILSINQTVNILSRY